MRSLLLVAITLFTLLSGLTDPPHDSGKSATEAEVKERLGVLEGSTTKSAKLLAIKWLRENYQAAKAPLAMPILKKLVKECSDNELRMPAIEALGSIAFRHKKPCPLVIIEAIMDPDKDVAWSAMNYGGAAWGESYELGSVDALLRCVTFKDVDVRSNSVVPLAEAGRKEKRVLEAIKKATTDADFGVRHNAQVALFKITDDMVVFVRYLFRIQEDQFSDLPALPKDSEEGKRNKTARELHLLGGAMLLLEWSSERPKDLAKTLMVLMEDKEPPIRRGAARIARAGVTVDPKQALERVRRSEKSKPTKQSEKIEEKPSLKYSLAAELEKLKVRDRLTKMRDDDSDENVRDSARRALQAFEEARQNDK